MNDLQHRILTGMLIVIPVFAILLFVERLWIRFRDLSEEFGDYFGIASFFGSTSITILFLFMLFGLFLIVGSLARRKIVLDFQNSLDRSILQFVPGYLTYKNKMHETIERKSKKRIPVFLVSEEGKRPGILIEKNDIESVVFIPGVPDTNNGEVVIVSNEQVFPTEIEYLQFIKALQLSGKGILK